MFLVGILSWWYGKGWVSRIQIIKDRLRSSVDFFSIDLLITTLFSPFRQISADESAVSLGGQISAFFDKLLSRFIGAFMRTFMILSGIVVLFLQILFGIIILLAWLIVPILPLIGLVMTTIGFVI